ncbi:hypothetical protein NE236_37080 [Actinoallomurus purpureus]|uniref:hypothetical protein n=1 Tax=Actinoallomurus purpureus TaxID=478114 RepID=UPI0020921C64|nr:hypothetical protein [Actinoallomurus purpureus]MCO6010586.1 hypothetical protein [Actinoallomurus purpureus]
MSEEPALEPPFSADDRTPARERWWRDPYLIVAVPVGLWAILVALQHAWVSDFLLHLATVNTLARDLWDPIDPMVGAASGSPYYSPYAVLLGLIKAMTGAPARTVLEAAGLANVALLLFAVRRFCRNLGGGPLVAALALVFTLLLWGIDPVAWSGFLGLYSLSWTMSYPSLIATALMLLVWDAFLRHRARPDGLRALATVALLGTLVVLIHPFTAVNMVIGLAAFVLADPRTSLGARPLRLAIGAAVAFLLVMVWPWSDVSTLFGAAGSFDAVHKVLITDIVKDGGFAAYGLALVGLPALVTGGRRPLGRELQILFLLAVAVVALGAATGSYGLARVIPVAMLPLHLALASYLAERARSVPRLVYAAVALIACCVGLYGESGGLIRAYWGDVSPSTLGAWGASPATPSYGRVLKGIHPGEVVITDDRTLARLVNARGAYTVAPAWPYPFVDEAVRQRDTAAFFAGGTDPRDRLAIADRYGVTCALVTRSRAVLRPDALPGFVVKARMSYPRAIRLCR